MNTVSTLFPVVAIITFHSSLFQAAGQGLQQHEQCPSEKRMQVLCYIALWYPKAYLNRFSANDVDPFLCTHIVLAYFEFAGGATENLNFRTDEKESALARSIIAKRDAKRSTQYLLCIGGYRDFNYDRYRKIATDLGQRQEFITNVLDLLKQHQADGIDFMWNYVGRRGFEDTGSKEEDLHSLAEITKALCSALKKHGFICVVTLVKAETRSLMLKPKYQEGITSIIRAADFVNIWTADILQAPIGSGLALMPQDLLIPPGPNDSSYYKGYEYRSINFVVEFYEIVVKNDTELLKKLSLVVVLQFGTHGLGRGENVSINTATDVHRTGNPFYGAINNYQYQYPYFKTCDDLRTDRVSRFEMVEFPGGVPVEIDYGQDSNTPNFAAIPTVSRSYVKKKVAFAKSHNLGGISIFHITADDIDGWCFNQTYPILNAINDQLGGCRFV